jgi:hypothetical protein
MDIVQNCGRCVNNLHKPIVDLVGKDSLQVVNSAGMLCLN